MCNFFNQFLWVTVKSKQKSIYDGKLQGSKKDLENQIDVNSNSEKKYYNFFLDPARCHYQKRSKPRYYMTRAISAVGGEMHGALSKFFVETKSAVKKDCVAMLVDMN